MDRTRHFGVLGLLLYFCCFACATLTINQIVGPDSVEDGAMDDLVLDCDFDAEGEEDVVVKWFFNGMEVQIYQWIASGDHAYASGPLKDLIDVDYKVSDNPKTMLRALKFKDVNPALSGNYTCKVSSEQSDKWMTKQVIVYSPATSFHMFLIAGDDELEGDEAVICEVNNVSPKPSFDLYLAGTNGTVSDLPDMFEPKRETFEDDGFYNITISMPFNSSFLEEGTTKFVCQLSIPGTNYSETKSVEHIVEYEVESQSAELLYEEGFFNPNSTNSTDESNHGDNGNIHLQSSLLTVFFLLCSLVLAT